MCAHHHVWWWIGVWLVVLCVASATLVGTAHAEEVGVDTTVDSTEGGSAEVSTTVRVVAINDELRIEDKTNDFAGSVSDVAATLAREPVRVQVAGGKGPYTYTWSLTVDGEAVSDFSDAGTTASANVEVTHQVQAGEISREGEYRYALSVTDAAGKTAQTEVRVVVSSDYVWGDGDSSAGEVYNEDLYFHDEYTGADIKVAGSVHKDTRLVVDSVGTSTPAYLALLSAARGTPLTGAWVIRLLVDGQVAENVEPFIGPLLVSVRYPGDAQPEVARTFARVDNLRVQGRAGEYTFPDNILFLASDAQVQEPECAIDDQKSWLTFETDVVGAFATLGAASPGASRTVSVKTGAGGSVWPADTVRVAEGASTTFALLPDAGYAVKQATASNGTAVQVDNNMLTVGPVSADTEISVSFERIASDPDTTYTVSARVEGGHGSVSVGGGEPGTTARLQAARGSTVAVTFAPEAGYVVDTLTVNGAPAMALAGGYVLSALSADAEVVVTYRAGIAPPQTVFSMSASVEGEGGSVSPTYAQVPLGGQVSVSFIPDAGYVVSEVKVDGAPIEAPTSSYVFENIAANHEIAVTFKKPGDTPGPEPGTPDIVGPDGKPYPTDPDGNPVGPDGKPLPVDPETGAPLGPDGKPLPIGPDGNYHPDPDDPLYGVDDKGNQVVKPAASYTVKVTSEGKGSVSPSGEVAIAAGASQSFWFYPDEGWRVERVEVDGALLSGTPSHWKLAEAQGDHTLHVVFARETAASGGSNGGGSGGSLTKTGDAIAGAFALLAVIALLSAGVVAGHLVRERKGAHLPVLGAHGCRKRRFRKGAHK